MVELQHQGHWIMNTYTFLCTHGTFSGVSDVQAHDDVELSQLITAPVE